MITCSVLIIVRFIIMPPLMQCPTPTNYNDKNYYWWSCTGIRGMLNISELVFHHNKIPATRRGFLYHMILCLKPIREHNGQHPLERLFAVNSVRHLAGMTSVSPALTICGTPPTVKRPVPSSTVTIASPVESCVPISSPLSNANSVMLTALFCASVLLTTCPD